MGLMVSTETVHKMKHDLRAPAVNVRGFVGEIAQAIHELTALLDQNYETLPEEFSQQVKLIVKDDLRPCLDFLEKASVQFDTRIEEVAQMMLTASNSVIEKDSNSVKEPDSSVV